MHYVSGLVRNRDNLCKQADQKYKSIKPVLSDQFNHPHSLAESIRKVIVLTQIVVN